MFASLLRRPAVCRNTRKLHIRPVETLEGRQLMSLGAEFPVYPGPSTASTIVTSLASASSANGTSVVVWEEQIINKAGFVGEIDVLAQRLDATGAKLGPVINVVKQPSTYATNPSVAMDSAGSFVISWTQAPDPHTTTSRDSNVLAQKFNASAAPIGGIVQVGVGTFREDYSGVAMDTHGNFVVTYGRYTDGTHPDLFAKRYNAASQLQGVISVTTGALDFTAPRIAMTSDGRFDIAYITPINGTFFDQVFVKRYAANGSLLGTTLADKTSSLGVSSAAIAMDNQGDAVVAYTNYSTSDSHFRLQTRRLSASGFLGPVTTVRSRSFSDTYAASTSSPWESIGIAFQPDAGFSGAYAVTSSEQTGISQNGITHLGEVAVVDGSNTVTHVYDVTNAYSTSITARGAAGFQWVYCLPNPDSPSNQRIAARRGGLL